MKTKYRFKKGDRVIRTNCSLFLGETGTVVLSKESIGVVHILFDDETLWGGYVFRSDSEKLSSMDPREEYRFEMDAD